MTKPTRRTKAIAPKATKPTATKPRATTAPAAPRRAATADRTDLLARDIASLIDVARRTTARAVDTVMTSAYFEVGRRIVEEEQHGASKADYGAEVLERLARVVSARLGRGFGQRNLFHMRAFFLAYREHIATSSPEILQTLSAKSPKPTREGRSPVGLQKLQTRSAIFDALATAPRFPLPWSHYVELLRLEPAPRAFYETEALRGGWTVRQLKRQIDTQVYERALRSKNKTAVLAKAPSEDAEAADPRLALREPLVLEFLDLKDEYSESDLEESLIHRLESFLLELGDDFAFLGRQRRLRIGDEWYRVDLVFFHRALRCLVLIDLKLGRFTHADAGQMNLYVQYAREHWSRPDESPAVGLVLCASKDDAVAHYALGGLRDRVLVARYQTALPTEERLAAALRRAQESLLAQGASQPASARTERQGETSRRTP